MNEEKNYHELNWYLPEVENKENIVKIPVAGINKDSCDNMRQKLSDEYLAQIIKDFYYAETWRRSVDEDVYVNDSISWKIKKLNDIHGDLVLLKRIFNDVLVSSKNISENENQLINKFVWKDIDDILNCIGHYRYDVFEWLYWRWSLEEFHNIYSKIDNIENLLKEVQRCYEEEDIEEIINARQVLFQEIRNKFFTKEDEEQFIRLWIKTFGLIFKNPYLSESNTCDISESIDLIDQLLGEAQRQICSCMLQYSQCEYDKIIKENGRIRKFLWYLKCNKEVKKEYIAKTEHMRCYSLMWSKGEKIQYFALSGIDMEQYYGNLLMQLVPKHLHYEQVILNDNVRYYFNYRDYFRYGDIKNKNCKKIKKLVSCCERKLLTKLDDPNKKYHMFIKFEPCEKCKRAFYDYDPKNQIDIISPKHSYKKEREKIKEEDDWANEILIM